MGGEKVTEIEQVYKAYFNDVYLFILSLSKDEHIAEEIASEAFFKAMNSLNQFKGNCELRVWLCQIAKNCYYSYLRKNKKLRQSPSLKKNQIILILSNLFSIPKQQ
jgi:RNA polymerase sigma-70 factor (ECF subfamily)